MIGAAETLTSDPRATFTWIARRDQRRANPERKAQARGTMEPWIGHETGCDENDRGCQRGNSHDRRVNRPSISEREEVAIRALDPYSPSAFGGTGLAGGRVGPYPQTRGFLLRRAPGKPFVGQLQRATSIASHGCLERLDACVRAHFDPSSTSIWP